jgi:hypothetical protein
LVLGVALGLGGGAEAEGAGNAQPEGHALGQGNADGGAGNFQPGGADVEGFGAGVVDFGLPVFAGFAAGGAGVASSLGPPPTPPTGTGSQPSSDADFSLGVSSSCLAFGFAVCSGTVFVCSVFGLHAKPSEAVRRTSERAPRLR